MATTRLFGLNVCIKVSPFGSSINESVKQVFASAILDAILDKAGADKASISTVRFQPKGALTLSWTSTTESLLQSYSEIGHVVCVQKRIQSRIEVRQDNEGVQQPYWYLASTAEGLDAVDGVQWHPAHHKKKNTMMARFLAVLTSRLLACCGRTSGVPSGDWILCRFRCRLRSELDVEPGALLL
ncbi:hypothetical protein CEXT_109841 [Caerostris extrusa]|uniref:Uncharacterized protein n=1 Tax=Caerostris extrusa TaxID=172846 RepID=A0AAV4XGJ6_CAEEX|nr:hypothetical protein CEXT_109841 [Caerostris extrusa]